MDSVKTVIMEAPAKINVGLRVLRKREDGFHDIETVFVAVDWYDQIELREADSFEMTCSDPALPVDGRNLCVQAVHRLASTLGRNPEIAVHLNKRIPWGAGLGGGSSDAAATLMGLISLWDQSPTETQLNAIACELGSDVPFFLNPRPSVGEGRGERLTHVNLDEKTHSDLSRYSLVIAAPKVHVSTKDAYARVKPNDERSGDLFEIVSRLPVAAWPDVLENDFERVVFSQYPELESVKTHFYDRGASYASMSGSGSSVYALFEGRADAEEALESSGFRGWVGRLLL